jgi:signal transduction histidine kinase
MASEHLRFSPDILRRLGEELIPHPDQGVIELARNAYDADATFCNVRLRDTGAIGGSILVEDNGDGMTGDSIRDGWLLLGRSTKNPRERTRLGRLPVGDKGLGRLAALRLGATATMTTRPRVEPGAEYELVLDWRRFDAARAVEDVQLEVQRRPTREQPGTRIEISDLGVRLTRRDVKRLARSLLLLADPFRMEAGFSPRLDAPDFQDLEERVATSYFDQAVWELRARLDENGRATAELVDHRSGSEWTAAQSEIARAREDQRYTTAPCTFELWNFPLGGSFARPASVSVGGLRDWLSVVGGVHVYHRGLRVPPYGDEGFDWLDMNLRRARSPEERPSTNTSLGRVVVDDVEDVLTQKTDRTGFIENEAFFELRAFGMDVLDWAARVLLEAAETRRQRVRQQTERSVTRARASLDRAVATLPPKARPELERAAATLERTVAKQTAALQTEIELYRTMATIGTTTAVFAHESAKPATQIDKLARTAERVGRRQWSSDFEPVSESLSLIRRYTGSLKTFAMLPLRLLEHEKRRRRRLDVHAVVAEVLDLFQPFCEEAGVTVERELEATNSFIRATPASVESIVANLLINAINALEQAGDASARRVVVRTTTSQDRLVLTVLDDGPGIQRLSVEDVWLPGQTTRAGGTGLGLTIVRDSAIDLGGNVSARAHGELGGAEFSIDLPLDVRGRDGSR